MDSMDSMDSIVPVLEGTQPSRPSWSRRGFVMTSLATGFALAVQPVSAETITTDTNGLAAGEVEVPVKGGEIPAYRAMPANGGPFPTVLVASEVWGVNRHPTGTLQDSDLSLRLENRRSTEVPIGADRDPTSGSNQ